MENGKLTLIASTTENPYFYVYNAVLSRSTVFEFKPVTAEEVLPVVRRGIQRLGEKRGAEVQVEEGVEQHIARSCGGDVRKALNAVEALFSAHAMDQSFTLTLEEVQMVAQRSAMRYDRAGDDHFDILSALHKSIRGSGPALGGGGSALCLPPYPLCLLRGHRPSISPGHPHCESLH